jgi:hypothetical protein
VVEHLEQSGYEFGEDSLRRRPPLEGHGHHLTRPLE